MQIGNSRHFLSVFIDLTLRVVFIIIGIKCDFLLIYCNSHFMWMEINF